MIVNTSQAINSTKMQLLFSEQWLHRRPNSRQCTTQSNHISNFQKDLRTFKDAIIHGGDNPNISLEISSNQCDLHTSGNGLGNDSVEIFLKVILANGPNGKWDVKWARVVPSEASGPLPHRAHNQVTQEVNLQAHMEGPRQAKPTITQPKVKPNFQVNAPKPKWVWAPLARGLEKPEKAVEGSLSSPPPDFHLELGHNHVSVHS